MRNAALALGFAAALGACAPKHAGVEPGPYSGPRISMSSTGPRHIATVEAPSSGYRAQFDRKERLFDRTEVYLTVTRPDPAQMHAQALVNLNVDTTVISSEPVVLFARIRDFGPGKSETPYRLVNPEVAPPEK